ncbi:MAG: phosphatase PAP2 family protein [Devosia sp.]
MADLSKPWPLGVGEKRWWITVGVVVLLLAACLAVDRQLSLYVQSWPEAVQVPLQQATRYGETDWILIPSAALFFVTALVAVFTRWRLMRTMLWQFAGIYAFIFVGVGLPSLFTTVVKRLVGRGRPMHFDDTGLFGRVVNLWDWTYQSFPSGHATTAFALATVLGFLSERWFYPALVLAAVIGVSRVALGVHYPSDVLAGAVVGLLGAYSVRWLFARQGWMFVRRPDGRIRARPLSSLQRYLMLKRRGIARAQRPGRP